MGQSQFGGFCILSMLQVRHEPVLSHVAHYGGQVEHTAEAP